MDRLAIYNIIHLVGLMLLFISLGAMIYHSFIGGQKSEKGRKLLIFSHGIGMFLLLLGGFGMLARYGIHWPWPGWVFVKFGIWLVLGGVVALIYRKPKLSVPLWWIVVVLGALSAYMAIYKPF